MSPARRRTSSSPTSRGEVLFCTVAASAPGCAPSFPKMPPRKRARFSRPKDHSRAMAAARQENDISLLRDEVAALRERLTSPFLCAGAHMMQQGQQERHKLIDYLWAADYSDCSSEVLLVNNDLKELLAKKTENQYYTDTELGMERKEKRLNFAAGLLVRNQNVHRLPLQQAILAVTAKAKHVNNDFWDVLTSLRVLPSIKWTNDLVRDALARNPGPPYEVVDWVSAVVFDNNTTWQNYSARHNADTQGQQLNMTNWATLHLPRRLLAHLNMHPLRYDRRRLIFKDGFDKYTVINLCHPHHPDIKSNQSRRWRDSLTSIAAGTYFKRPDYQPFHAQHLTYRPPIWDRLQSKHDDVEEEVRIFQRQAAHRNSLVMFVGGDGLAVMRLNDMLARDYRQFMLNPLDANGSQLPSVIPVQGVSPPSPHQPCLAHARLNPPPHPAPFQVSTPMGPVTSSTWDGGRTARPCSSTSSRVSAMRSARMSSPWRITTITTMGWPFS